MISRRLCFRFIKILCVESVGKRKAEEKRPFSFAPVFPVKRPLFFVGRGVAGSRWHLPSGEGKNAKY